MSFSARINNLCSFFMICIILNNCFVSGKTVPFKRSVSPDENEEHTDNSVDRISYDEYPVCGCDCNLNLAFLESLILTLMNFKASQLIRRR